MSGLSEGEELDLLLKAGVVEAILAISAEVFEKGTPIEDIDYAYMARRPRKVTRAVNSAAIHEDDGGVLLFYFDHDDHEYVIQVARRNGEGGLARAAMLGYRFDLDDALAIRVVPRDYAERLVRGEITERGGRAERDASRVVLRPAAHVSQKDPHGRLTAEVVLRRVVRIFGLAMTLSLGAWPEGAIVAQSGGGSLVLGVLALVLPPVIVSWMVVSRVRRARFERTVRAFVGDDDAASRRAEAELMDAGPAAVPALLAFLPDSAKDARARVARLLGRIDDPRAYVPLLGLLTADDGAVRSAAGFALLSSADSRIRQLRELVKDILQTDHRWYRYALGKTLRELERCFRRNEAFTVEYIPPIYEHAGDDICADGDTRVPSKPDFMKAPVISVKHAQRDSTQPPASASAVRVSVETYEAAKMAVERLFARVKGRRNNRRAEMVDRANTLIADGSKEIGRGKTTAEVRERIEQAIRDVSGGEGRLTRETKKTIEYLRQNMDRLVSDGILQASRVLSANAEEKSRYPIIAFELDWIPGYDKRGLESQHAAMNRLVTEMRTRILDALRKRYPHAQVVCESSDRLAQAVFEAAGNDRRALGYAVVLASRDTVKNHFAFVESMAVRDRPFLAVVDPAGLQEDFQKLRDGELLDVQVLNLMTLAIELAIGKDEPDIPLIIPTGKEKVVILYPRAGRVPWRRLRQRNDGRAEILGCA